MPLFLAVGSKSEEPVRGVCRLKLFGRYSFEESRRIAPIPSRYQRPACPHIGTGRSEHGLLCQPDQQLPNGLRVTELNLNLEQATAHAVYGQMADAVISGFICRK
jgi:hypothetical protein